MDTAPQTYEDRISRVRLWTLIPAMFGPALAWTFLARGLSIPATVTGELQVVLLWAGASGWLLKVAPRPYSVRASFGQPLDLAGWRVVALAFLGNVSVRVLWWIQRDCRDLLQEASLRGGYTFRLPHTHWDAFAIVNAALLAPLIEELLFRGTIFRNCRGRYSPAMAALLSSMLFGMIHAEGVTVFLSGLTYLLAYTRTRSLWAPIVLHFLNNAGWVVLSKYYLGDTPELRLEGPWQLAGLALVICAGVGVWLQFLRSHWHTLGDPLPPDATSTPLGLRFGAAEEPEAPVDRAAIDGAEVGTPLAAAVPLPLAPCHRPRGLTHTRRQQQLSANCRQTR